jgi:hypothetical protein
MFLHASSWLPVCRWCPHADRPTGTWSDLNRLLE